MTLACLAAGPVMLLLGAGILAMFYLLTLYMQLVRGYPALHTGLAYLPVIVGTGVAVGVAPRLLMKAPARAVIAAGLILYAGRRRPAAPGIGIAEGEGGLVAVLAGPAGHQHREPAGFGSGGKRAGWLA